MSARTTKSKIILGNINYRLKLPNSINIVINKKELEEAKKLSASTRVEINHDFYKKEVKKSDFLNQFRLFESIPTF